VTFFASRWVTGPEHVAELEPATLPAGFRAAGAASGIKPDGLDVGVLFCESADAVSAARFTTNARIGAPVIVSKAAALDRLRRPRRPRHLASSPTRSASPPPA
jgi:glutamate N-acetyltransferase/amino-acid N-acetyltransferase